MCPICFFGLLEVNCAGWGNFYVCMGDGERRFLSNVLSRPCFERVFCKLWFINLFC